MTFTCRYSVGSLALLVSIVCGYGLLDAAEAKSKKKGGGNSVPWQEQSVEYARIMSQVKWTPVAEGMPKRGGHFTKGTEYTGVPYSSVKSVGRYIGFDIYLKTFLAAVENPHSVLYTESLYGEVSNAECYYGKVCSSYTSYALQCGFWYVSRLHGPEHREGVTLVEPQSAQFARAGDIIYRPPAKKGAGAHIELVTGVTRDDQGQVTHVRVEESRPQTTKGTNYNAKGFNSHIGSKGRELYRINDLDAWRDQNRAESFLFPDYDEDSAKPSINRVLLLDRGDWVAYHKGQAVKFNVMDRDEQGVKALVIKRGDSVIETINQPPKGVLERSFSICGEYTAHGVMNDGSLSQACEFSVCDLDFKLPAADAKLGESLEISFSSDNMKIIMIHLMGHSNQYARHNVFLSEQDRRNGSVVIPADLMKDKGTMQLWLIGENKYGRLKKRRDIVVIE